MSRQFSRRKFLVYGSAALGTSILLKSCASGTTTSTTAESPAADAASPAATAAASGDAIKVGILHSLSGTMAISEKSVVDS